MVEQPARTAFYIGVDAITQRGRRGGHGSHAGHGRLEHRRLGLADGNRLDAGGYGDGGHNGPGAWHQPFLCRAGGVQIGSHEPCAAADQQRARLILSYVTPQSMLATTIFTASSANTKPTSVMASRAILAKYVNPRPRRILTGQPLSGRGAGGQDLGGRDICTHAGQPVHILDRRAAQLLVASMNPILTAEECDELGQTGHGLVTHIEHTIHIDDEVPDVR